MVFDQTSSKRKRKAKTRKIEHRTTKTEMKGNKTRGPSPLGFPVVPQALIIVLPSIEEAAPRGGEDARRFLDQSP